MTLDGVRSYGVPAILCRADIADDRAVRDMVARCRDELGGLDILVNNAAKTRFIEHKDLEALTDDVWDEILGVNLKRGPSIAAGRPCRFCRLDPAALSM